MQKNKILALILSMVAVGCTIKVQPTATRKSCTSGICYDTIKPEFVRTKFTVKMGDGEYPVYITNSGSCFINKKSKAGGTYRYDLEPKVSIIIRKELYLAYETEKR